MFRINLIFISYLLYCISFCICICIFFTFNFYFCSIGSMPKWPKAHCPNFRSIFRAHLKAQQPIGPRMAQAQRPAWPSFSRARPCASCTVHGHVTTPAWRFLAPCTLSLHQQTAPSSLCMQKGHRSLHRAAPDSDKSRPAPSSSYSSNLHQVTMEALFTPQPCCQLLSATPHACQHPKA